MKTALVIAFKFLNNVQQHSPSRQRRYIPTDAVLILGLVVCLSLMLLGCGDGDKPSSDAPSPRPIMTHTLRQATPLPSTWTPSPAPTITITPSPTDSPILPTETQTPIPTETLTVRAICDEFALVGYPQENAMPDYNGYIGFSWENAPPDSLVVLSIVRNGEETLTQFSPLQGFNAYFAMSSLPTWGSYTWTLSLYLESYGELCRTSGEFFRQPWWAKPIENPFAPSFAG